ncbi:pilus assembly protein [Chania multitudinisentens]|nr:pilus assembly protein [Chania multitudinisentens]
MKQTMNRIGFGLVIGLMALSGLARADGQLMVMPARSMVEGQQTKTVQVSNLGDKPLYLKVDLVRIENPGETPERKTAIGDISLPEMMANPGKLTLGPGQKRDINLVALKAPAKETLYRLYIVPVSSIKVVGEESKDKVSAPITFGVGYGVVVHHLPPSGAQVKGWNHQCTSAGLQLTVTGNVSSLFRDLQVTPAGSLSAEQKVFPGTPRVFPVETLKGNADGQPFDIRCP